MEPSDDFKAWFAKEQTFLVELATRVIFGVPGVPGEDFLPKLLIFSGDKVAVVPIPLYAMSRPEMKDAVADLHKQLALQPGIAGVIFACETWRVVLPKGKTFADVDMRKSIHDHPDRDEALMLHALRGHMGLSAMYVINRVRKRLDEVKDLTMVGGRFAHEDDPKPN